MDKGGEAMGLVDVECVHEPAVGVKGFGFDAAMMG